MINYANIDHLCTYNQPYVTDYLTKQLPRITIETFKIKFDDGDLILLISQKELLSKESLFFDRLLNSNFKEKNQSEITVKGIAKNNFEKMMTMIE